MDGDFFEGNNVYQAGGKAPFKISFHHWSDGAGDVLPCNERIWLDRWQELVSPGIGGSKSGEVRSVEQPWLLAKGEGCTLLRGPEHILDDLSDYQLGPDRRRRG